LIKEEQRQNTGRTPAPTLTRMSGPGHPGDPCLWDTEIFPGCGKIAGELPRICLSSEFG